MRARVVDAAIDTLKRDGFAGTSIRAIARTGGFNSALISYYFGSLNGLLLAALDHSNEERLLRYREAMDAVTKPQEFAKIALRIYRQDIESGDITVFSELVAASLAYKELGPELVARAAPWLDFIQGALERVLGDTPIAAVLPPADLSRALLAFYLGVNLLTHLDPDRSQTDAVFDMVNRAAGLLGPLFRPPA